MLYFSVLSRWFKRRRGLAFGLALSGNGLSAFFMPSLADRLIASFGWRQAYVIIGLMVISVTIPVVAILLKETPQEKGLLPDGEASETPVSETGEEGGGGHSGCGGSTEHHLLVDGLSFLTPCDERRPGS